jgi:hypothetical protein
MEESYSEILARYAGPESYADDGNIVGVATAGVHGGPEIELRHQAVPCADTVKLVEGNIESIANGKIGLEHGGVEGLEHVWKLQAREPGDPVGSLSRPVTAGDKDGQSTSQREMLT